MRTDYWRQKLHDHLRPEIAVFLMPLKCSRVNSKCSRVSVAERVVSVVKYRCIIEYRCIVSVVAL